MSEADQLTDRYREPKLRMTVNSIGGLICFVLCMTWLTTGLPFYFALTNGFDRNTVAMYLDYYDTLLSNGNYWFAQYANLFQTDPFIFLAFLIATVAFFLAVFVTIYHTNPYTHIPNIYGDTRAATLKDIKMMEERKQLGIVKGFIGFFGRFEQHALMLIETVSALILAPPGTGKTAGFVVPTILKSKFTSWIVHDIKPEIHDMVSGFLSLTGIVFRFEWSATDKMPPDGRPLEEGIYYPCWNPLSEKSLPRDPSNRANQIQGIANILIEDSKGSDPFFTPKGRAALIGLTMYLVHKINILKDYRDIPAEYLELEASFPMLLAWFYYARDQFARREAENVDPTAIPDMKSDNTKKFFQALSRDIIDQINDPDVPQTMKYPYRAFQEFSELANLPIETRDGILGTATGDKMDIFKTESVIQRTSRCDFSFADIRGILKPGGNPDNRHDWMPVHVFICVNTKDADTMSPITSVLLDLMSQYTVSYGPGESDDKGQKLGPLVCGYMLDEFPQMKKLASVIKGPAVGRGKGNSYFLIGQDFAQIELVYDKPSIGVIMSTTAIKYILPQNNPDTIETFIKMAGSYTMQDVNESSQSFGWGKEFKILPSVNQSKSWKEAKFFRPSDLSSLPPGKAWVLAQNFINRPILVDIPWFFKDPEMVSKVYNPKSPTNNFVPMPPMPPEYKETAVIHYTKLHQRRANVIEAHRAKKYAPRALVLTPKDAQSFRREPFSSDYLPLDDKWWSVRLAKRVGDEYQTTNEALDTPDDDQLMEMIDGYNVVVWNQQSLDDLNQRLGTGSYPLVPENKVTFLQPLCEKYGRGIHDLSSPICYLPENDPWYGDDYGPPMSAITAMMHILIYPPETAVEIAA